MKKGTNDVERQTDEVEAIVPAENLIPQETEIDAGDYEQYLAVAKKLSTYKPTISISSKYYEFTKPGEKARGVFLGMTVIKKKQENGDLLDLDCVQWLGEDGCIYVNAGAALVSTFRQFLPPKGCPIEITYEAKKERTKLYDVRILN